MNRLVTGPIRLMADRTASTPHVDADAMTLLLVGALINVKILEMLGGHDPVRISHKRIVEAWADLPITPCATPVAVQLCGRRNNDETVLHLAQQIETARPWAHLRPL